MDDAITFGQWVKQRRKALSMTQVELGRLISCSVIMVKKIEADQRRPSIRVTKLLAGYLKITPQERQTFMQLAHPNLTHEKIEEIISPYSQSLNQPARKRATNLRTPLTALIGRSQEVARICKLLTTPNVRLVTLTGAGGIGKTRLGIQVATELKDQFVYGCWFISLAALNDPDLVIPTIARSLGIKESRDWALDEALFNHLADKDMLLILDNFEQVLPAATQVAELLMFAPDLKLLITSRTILHILGEYEFVVPPLRFVDPNKSPSSQEVVDSPAVKLFVERAQAVNVSFALTPESASIIARICSHLDGLPLAIELAASRIKFLSPAALLSRLEGSSPEDSPLNELAGGARNLPMRQQTMRRTIDWSYNLLNESEQDLFRHLAVFVGGCTLEAAAVICGDMTKGYLTLTPPAGVAQIFASKLASLVDQSMLLQVKTPGEATRFGMLESLHEYAVERLTARNKEWVALKRQHARYFMALAEAAEPKFAGPEQEIWLDRLEMEHDNLLAALAWSASSPQDAELGLKLVGAGWQFWLIRGYVNEGLIWLQRFLEGAPSAPKLDRARALNGAGFLNWMWGDFSQAKALLNESLVIFDELGNKHGKGWVLNHLGHVALAENELEQAHNFVVKSLELFRELGADANIAWDLLNLGDIVEVQGDNAQAGLHFAESQALFQKIGDRRGMAWAQDRLGQQAHAQQRYDDAIKFYRESISLFRKVGDKRSTAWVLNHLGKVALALDNFEEARLIVEESLTLFREITWLLEGAWATLDMGDAALEFGSEVRAKFFFTKSLELFREVDSQRGAAEALKRLEGLSHVKNVDGE